MVYHQCVGHHRHVVHRRHPLKILHLVRIHPEIQWKKNMMYCILFHLRSGKIFRMYLLFFVVKWLWKHRYFVIMRKKHFNKLLKYYKYYCNWKMINSKKIREILQLLHCKIIWKLVTFWIFNCKIFDFDLMVSFIFIFVVWFYAWIHCR